MRAASATALAIACAAACVAPGYDIVDSLGDAGESGGGGRSGSSSGGRAGKGGSVSTGGAPNGGDGGEDPGSGGSNTGGASGSGKGGGPPTGGVSGGPPTGGVSGGPPTGGAGGLMMGGSGGGPMFICNPTFTVSSDGFVQAPGSTCFHGYAYAGGDVGSSVMPTTYAACGAGCTLRVSGTIGPATAANMFSGVVYIGFNVNQAAGTTTALTRSPTGTSLVISFTKTTGPSPIRVQLNGASVERWCATLTASPATIPYTMFNTQCWDNTGLAYAKQPLTSIQLVVPGAATAQPIDITLVSVRDQ